MVINHEIIAIIKGSPLINNVIVSVALLCNFAVFVANYKTAKTLLTLSCVIAICMPIYDFISGYIKYVNLGGSVPEPFMAVFIWLVFSPTNLVLAAILASAGNIKRLNRWSVIVFVSIIMSWFGIASLHYMAAG